MSYSELFNLFKTAVVCEANDRAFNILPDLLEALGGLGGGGGGVIPLELTHTGPLNFPAVAISTPAGGISFPASNLYVSSDNAWVRDLSFDEDNSQIGLETLAFDNLGGVQSDMELTYFKFLTALGMPELEIIGGEFRLSDCENLSIINFPKLKAVGGSLNIQDCYSAELTSFPLLTYIGENLYLENLNFTNTILELPALAYIGGSIVIDSYSGTEIELPELRRAAGIQISQTCLNLTSISFPKIEEIYGSIGITWGSFPELTSFDLGTNLKYMQNEFNITFGSLDQTSVDNILVALAALDGTNGTTVYENQNVTIRGGAASPSLEVGNAAVLTLRARGCTVDVAPS